MRRSLSTWSRGRTWTLSLLSVLAVAPGPARSPDEGTPVRFGRLSLEDGLSQSSVYCIIQDRRGYLWFGTADGLNRYDGYGFTVYRRRSGDSTSLSDNTVSAICEDSLGYLWVGTMAQGLNMLDPYRGRFVRMPTGEAGLPDGRIRALATDRFGRVWAGSQGGGLAMVNPLTRHVTVYQHSPDNPVSLPHNTVRALMPDETGLWIGTDGGGVCRMLWSDTSRILRAGEPGIPPGLRRIEQLYRDRAGDLWAGTVDEGAARIRILEGRAVVTRFLSRPNDPSTITGDVVQAFCEDGEGTLWIGTWEGLNRLVPSSAGFAVRRFTHDPTDPTSLSANVIHDIVLDRSGVMWLGTRGGGLSRFRTGPAKFSVYKHDPRRPGTIPRGSVRAIFADSLGFWVGTTGGGLAHIDEPDGSVRAFRHERGNPQSLSSDDVRTILSDHSAVLWVGTYGGGLNRIVDPAGRPRIFRVQTPVEKDDEVFAFIQDGQHRYWVGTQNGVVRFDDVDATGRRAVGVTHFAADGPDTARLSHRIVRLLYEDDRGAVWIGTYGGLNRVDPASDSVLHFLPDPDDPSAINSRVVVSARQDRHGHLWFGTFGGGLNHFDYATGAFTVIDESDGLPNAYVYGILADADGCLWLSTNRGLTRFRRERWHPALAPDSTALLFKTYDVRDGLQSNEFNAGASHASASGELFFGGIEGLNRFRPETVRDAAFSPPVTVTGFNIFERPLNLDSVLAESAELVLAHNQNHFSFEVASLDFTNPEKNRYRYMLDGLDEEWIDAGTRRYVAYTNLGAGSYVFRVRGTNSDGVWSAEEASVPLRILPPFWQTWWFRLSGLLLLGGVAAAVVGSRRRAFRREREARERFLRQLIESQEGERKRIAGELHDGLGQNLLIIKNRALLGLESAGSGMDHLREISELAGLTIGEVRTIAYGLRPYQLDRLGLTKAIQGVCRQIQESARVRVDASIENIDGLIPQEMEINLYRIVQEGLNNAVKHAAATSIAVDIRREGARLAVEIRDDGTGFTADAGDGERAHGFGLSGIRERARMLGGEAAVHSGPGSGTRITATIPLEKHA